MDYTLFSNKIKSMKRGDKKSQEELLEMFKPLILKNSIINGKVDEDCVQELNIVFLEAIERFEINK